MAAIQRERIVAAGALIGILVLHAFTPTKAAPENAFGYASGYLALAATIVAFVGLVQRKDWGRQLLGLMGASITLGFLLLHFLPYQNFLTDPYVGREGRIGWVQWGVVIVAMLLGVWAVIASVRKSEHRKMTPDEARIA